MANISKILTTFSVFTGLLFVGNLPAHADLATVSPGVNADGNPATVAVYPPAPWDPVTQTVTAPGDYRGANYPLWYEDNNGLRLTLCTDGVEGGFPCAKEGAGVYTDAQCTGERFYEYQEVVGFGNEGFYFKSQSFPFDVPLTGLAVGGFAQMQLLLETTWGPDERLQPDGTIDGQPIFIEQEDGTCISAAGGDLHRVEPGHEMLFARNRLRVLPASPQGWYRMTYPYGVKTVYHPQDGATLTERTEVRQLVGDLRLFPGTGRIEMQDFTIALNDPQALIDKLGEPAALASFIGLRETGYINDAAAGLKSIGPFLYKPDYLTDPQLQVVEGNKIFQYIGRVPNEANPAASPGHQVLGSTIPVADHVSGFQNYFRIEYQPGSINVDPDAGAWVEVGYTDLFNVVGKLARVGRTGSPLSPGVISPLLLE